MSGRSNRQRQKSNAPVRRDQQPAQGSRTRAAATRGNDMLYAERTYTGPLPEPVDLQAYDMIVPGAAERIISVFERQAEHRHDLEQRVIDGSESRAGIGQWLAFIVMLTGVVGGCVVAVVGEPKAGAGIVAAAFAAGSLTYVIGGRAPKPE